MSYTISGIDVSHHQGSVDFKQVAASGQRFAIAKATEGVNYVDPRWLENWRKLRDLDGEIYRGAYHFARPSSVGGERDGRAEALDFCKALKAGGGYLAGALPPALDFEEYSESDAKDNIPWIRAFIMTVEDELGRSPMIYTGANIWASEVGNTDEFVHLPLWLVNYTRRSEPPRLARMPWGEFTFWQWSGGGQFAYGPRVPGVRGVVDLNRFNGNEDDLAGLAMMNEPEPGPCDPDHEALNAMLASVEHELRVNAERLGSIRQMLSATGA